jgi:phage shock protein A
VSHWDREQLEHRELRERLVRAATVEHRLHLHAAAERDSERRWRERADLAQARGMVDLAAQALQRAGTHRQRASDLDLALTRQRAAVEELRQAIRYPGQALRRSAATATSITAEADLSLERRLAQLERESRLEGDLEELRIRRATARRPPER